MMTLEAILAAQYNNKEEFLPEKVLAIDPGHETGWCVFTGGKLTREGQIITATEKGGINGSACVIHWNEIFTLLESEDWDAVVVENYRIYSNKLERHSFSEVPTLRLIGGIDAWCDQRGVGIFYQMATLAKGFVDDKKLTAWGFKKKHALRHSGDAIRHAIYFLIVSNLKRDFLKAQSKYDTE